MRTEQRQDVATPTCVVGIGASAGGLDALERFFDNVPPATGIAFVVVQHLSPDFRSMMDELLARHTDLPVQLVEDGIHVEPDHVYLIPPGKEMIISGGRLLLTERDKQQELTLPIDVFFRSLAQDCGPRAVAIVLSGGGSDGSRGVRAIHDAGGLVIVQDSISAQFDCMPRTARDAGVASWVLSPEEMPGVLVTHASRSSADTPARAHSQAAPRGVEAIYEMLEGNFGIDFTHYKPSTVTRRIERRLALARTQDIEAYVERLRRQSDELDVLYRDLLIGVTRFFRNEEAFEVLETTVLPELLAKGSKGTPLRAWVAGCATGEEAYSLAISLHELAEKAGGGREVKIFATDVHRGSLERAARGVYDQEAVANVSRERLERYFQRSGRTYQVVPEIRQTIMFAHHNVINDAPFTRVDLVSCRNLLIYLQPPAQQKALSLFHFALNRGGILFLGPSESPGYLASDYETIDKHWRLYRKFSDVRVPVDMRFQPTRPASSRTTVPITPATGLSRYSLSHLMGTYDGLLEEFMPPSLLVNDRGELVHAFGGASALLRPRDGRQGLDVLDMVDSELKMVLVGAMKRALTETAAVVFNGVNLGEGDARAPHRVSVRKIAGRNGGAPHLLISLERTDEDLAAASRPVSEREYDAHVASREHVGMLEAELTSTRENLQAAIEELETSNEELQASNEELLASNEELQSTNEELQSVNEELYTVNAEHQRKIAELTELTNDMDNLLSSTDVGTIFLDRELRIRRFTPQIAQTFNLVPHDVGRPIETFAHSLHHPTLVTELRRCLATRERIEQELRDIRGKSYFMRILPYIAKGQVDGVVLTLIDVSGLKAAEDALFHERYLLDSLLSGVPDAIYFKDVRGQFIRANQAMTARLGLSQPAALVGKTAFELVDRESARAQAACDEAVMRDGEPRTNVLQPRGKDEWDMATHMPMRDRRDEIVGVIGIYRDVTNERRSEAEIQEAVRRRDQFLAMLSHELRNPLGAIVMATRLLKASNGGGTNGSERYIATLERQSGQMARLLDDLLEASRVTQNKIELRRRVIDLRGVVKDAVDAVHSFFESRGVTLTVETDTEELRVDGDPARLQQIQVNLLNNAAKYTPRGGHVWLKAFREDGEAVVSIRDDGAGLPPEMLESVFEAFVQSTRTMDRSEGGLGLGLTLVRALVAMHGGKVTAHSEGVGRGSTFVVRIPLAQSVEAQPRTETRRPLSFPRHARVVVIEDNDDTRRMLCAFLETAGVTCHSAPTGPTGLALIREVLPDVALVDVGLPEMDGLEIARRVRSDPRVADVYLVAVTGYGRANDRAAALEAGFDTHMVKPVDPEQLLTWLRGEEVPLRPPQGAVETPMA